MVNKITDAITPLEEIDKINEIIDALGTDVAIDNLTITENSSNQLQTVAVKDNRSGNAIKTWTGTRIQYDAITTKDSNTIYNITDDTDVTLSLLELLYPVGSLYIGSGNLNACPLAVLGVGTWTLKSNNAIVTDVNSVAPCKGNGMTLGLTDGDNSLGFQNLYVTGAGQRVLTAQTGTYGSNVGTADSGNFSTLNVSLGVTSDGSKSGIEATVISTTLSVNIWERTA